MKTLNYNAIVGGGIGFASGALGAIVLKGILTNPALKKWEVCFDIAYLATVSLGGGAWIASRFIMPDLAEQLREEEVDRIKNNR